VLTNVQLSVVLLAMLPTIPNVMLLDANLVTTLHQELVLPVLQDAKHVLELELLQLIVQLV